MIRVGALVLLLLLLASCPRGGVPTAVDLAPNLESAAIARGLVRDPADRDIVGLYARDTDRVCIVRDGAAYRIGAYVDYGEAISCNAVGSVSRSGGRLGVRFGEGCGFDARFDGERIVFPARIPEGCEALCGRRASFAALDVARLSGSAAEARTMRDAKGKLPCAAQ